MCFAANNDIKSLVNDLLAEERIMLWDVELCRDDIIQGLPLGHFPAIIERFHYLYARALGKYYWANIDIATLYSIHIANKWFPEARFLHIVRDGRDVALSHETMPFGASNTLECAEQWCRRLHLNMMAGKILDSERYQIVKYEDLIIDTECTLKRICEFTEIAYSGAMLKYTEMVKKKVPEDKRWLWPVLDQPPQKSKVGKWKTGMGKAKRIVFENYAKDMLDELGYETYEKVPKFFPAYCYETWCFWGKGGRFRRMLNKVGLKKLSRLERSWMKMGKPIRKESSYETIQTTACRPLRPPAPRHRGQSVHSGFPGPADSQAGSGWHASMAGHHTRDQSRLPQPGPAQHRSLSGRYHVPANAVAIYRSANRQWYGSVPDPADETPPRRQSG